jgi:predicted  nucleic acid-binding Zn-ribbon protein
MTDKKLDNSANDQDENLETELGNLIKIDSQAFQDWLEANNSFKFVAGFSGCHSYRARKEALRGVNYWYAVKRVNGVLHKKFIGKSHEVTHSRLCEVANVIMQPPKPRVTAASTHESSTPGLEDRVKQLELIVNQLRGLDTVEETETLLDVEYLPSEELETKIQELTNELTNKDSKLSELTIQLHEVKIEAKAAKNDATLLNQEVKRLTNELDSKNSKLTELTSELANKDSQLQELTNNIVNLNSKLFELTNELANKDRELQELQSNPLAPVPQSPIIEQLTTDNGQLTNDDGQFTEDVESDRSSTENPSMTEEQIIKLFGLESIVTGTSYNKDSLGDDGILEKFIQNQDILSIFGVKFREGISPVNNLLKKLNFTVTQHKDKRTYHTSK